MPLDPRVHSGKEGGGAIGQNILQNMAFLSFLEVHICYEMDKTSISMFEIPEPGGSALGQYSI